MDYEKIIDEIKKKYKHQELLLDIYFYNYHNHYLYLRIDYYKNLKCYKLNIIDLIDYQDEIERIVSSIYIDLKTIEKIKSLLEKIDIIKDKDDKKNMIYLNYQDNSFVINRFINKDNRNLYGLFLLIFDYVPRRYQNFYLEVASDFFGTRRQYEFDDTFDIDLMEDDLDKLFSKEAIEKGNTYYEEKRVIFLEKIGMRYFAVIAGTIFKIWTIIRTRTIFT